MSRLCALACLTAAMLVADGVVRVLAQSPVTAQELKVTAASTNRTQSNVSALAELRGWDATVDDWIRSGQVTRVEAEPDRLVPGRSHERLLQRHLGVRVFGGDLTRQMNAVGQTESIFGTFFPNVTIPVAPTLQLDAAREALAFAGKGLLPASAQPELIILPTTGGFRLTWMAHVYSAINGSVRRVFVDADDGAAVWVYDDTQTQVQLNPNARIGNGVGVAGDRLKVSVEQLNPSLFDAVDLVRPGNNTTYDMKQNPTRTTQAINGQVTLAGSDIAQSSTLNFADPVVVATHAYAGYTYDYFFRHYGRAGINNNNLRLRLLVNPARPQDFPVQGGSFPLLFNNAAYYGSGFIAFGAGSINSSGTLSFRSFAAAVDIVGHEITHGVTDFTSDLIYQNESGALNESFSDMMSVAVEFDNQPVGTGPGRADWIQGEDCTPNGTGIRSLISPSSKGHPDHYSLRTTSTADNGGVHTNSNIVNHMFFLAIMGGTNRVSGLTVQGVGFQNRDKIETVIFRAFTQLLPSNATFSVARAATIQAARDLFGAGSATEQAIIQAWTAVGVS